MNDQPKNSVMEIQPLGAGREVGRSCVWMRYQEKQIMFDCGIHMNKNFQGVGSLPYFDRIESIDNIDLILITHFHLDHCGALPYFLRKYKFKGKIYMTRPTKEIYNLVLRDSIKVKSENLGADLINEQSIESSLNHIEVIDYDSEIYYQGIKIKCYNAGHVLGAAMFMVEIDGVRVLYTGDYSTENERHLRPAQIPNEKIHVLIVEATYGDTLHEQRQKREANFLNEIKSTLQRGGNVLLPVFATGRCHELLLILDEFWQQNSDIQQYPIYSTCTLAQKCINIFKKYISQLGERLAKVDGLFQFKFIATKKHIEDILTDPRPKVVMASPGLLQSGHSKQVYEKWCKDENSQVIITGPAVQGTIAYKLIHERDPEVKIRSYQISFSAHADYNQTSAFINALRPEHVILVHGISQKCNDLQNKITLNYKGVVQRVWAPKNLEMLELKFQKSNVGQSGCTAVGKLAEEMQQQITEFQFHHSTHKQIEVEPDDCVTECVCCRNDLNFYGVLLNTEHGFILADETDQDLLSQYGIQQNQVYNQMYLPLQCQLEQVINLILKLHPNAEYLYEDHLIRVSPQLDIIIPPSRTILQFKWISSPKTDELADGLAFFISSINQSTFENSEFEKNKKSGLINILRMSEFQIQQDNDNIVISFDSQVQAIIDLNTFEINFKQYNYQRRIESIVNNLQKK
ncbi:hypothetical protein pb186bvf_012506 [Paramecium bursaria]